jgi:hypothetical protein
MRIEGHPPQPQDPVGPSHVGGPTGAIHGQQDTEYGGTKALLKYYHQKASESLQKETDGTPESIKEWIKASGFTPTKKLDEILAQAKSGQPLSGDDMSKVSKEVGTSIYNSQMVSFMKGMITQLQQHEQAAKARQQEMKNASPT